MRLRRLGMLALLLVACGDDDTPAVDAGLDAPATEDAGADDAGPPRLEASLEVPPYVEVGETARLVSSSNAERFRFELGDGRVVEGGDAFADVSWPTVGRYTVRLVVGRGEDEATARALVSVTLPRTHTPRQSSTVALHGTLGAVVATDANLVTLFRIGEGTLELVRRVPTPAGPRTLAFADDGTLAVACQDDPALVLLADESASPRVIALPPASRPFGVVAHEGTFFVSLQALGSVAEVREAAVARTHVVLPDARGVAVTPDGRVAVTRWRSIDEGALALLTPSTGDVEHVALAFDPQPSNDSESGGLPSYLEQVLFDPTGTEAAIPSTQANLGEGTFRSAYPLTFETSVRAVVSFLEVRDGSFVERFARRKQFDNRGFAAAGVYSAHGDYLYVADRGHRAIERLDVLNRTQSGSLLGTGYAPDGLALTGDDRWLVVHASLDRRVELWNVSDLSALPSATTTLATVAEEPLDPQVLRGKQLFGDAADPRLARDGYLACAHCHLDGDSDHHVWDFTDRGEGLRRTPPLFARTSQGPLHWSANFDEVQDFENDIRAHFGGTGLLDDADFAATEATLGTPKAGRAADLDALAAYVASLPELRSPFRAADGSLPDDALRGRTVFTNAGCGSCHAGAQLTDSALVDGTPVLHDVGTLTAASGGRLGGVLPGLDTPTLHGLWHQPRFLHDGSADTIEAAVRAHEGVSVDEAAMADLVAYLRCLDGRLD
ncbi:MAG: hypothetical protein H6722_16065 [Sandaracinus sp.]|nr:hypothetical protein [Sandaracinus sp.]